MPLVRQFRGRPVKRTRRRGHRILVSFESSTPGRPGERLVVPLAAFVRERTIRYVPGASPPGTPRASSAR